MDTLDYSAIKRKIERECCSEHGENAKFIKTNDGFKMQTCCDNFGNTMSKKAEKIVGEETQNAINKMMKNIFK